MTVSVVLLLALNDSIDANRAAHEEQDYIHELTRLANSALTTGLHHVQPSGLVIIIRGIENDCLPRVAERLVGNVDHVRSFR